MVQEILSVLPRRAGEECPPVLDYESTSKKASRAWFLWGGTLFASLSAQLLFLPCLCGDSGVKMQFALGLDIMFIVRGGLAICFREQSIAWLVYGFVIFSSAFWIEPLLHSSTIEELYGRIGIHAFTQQ